MGVINKLVTFGLIVLAWSGVSASDWPHWRGPQQNGVSPETGLISSWSPDGENLVWKADFIGRSTPIVLNGRVYVIGRSGQDITEQVVDVRTIRASEIRPDITAFAVHLMTGEAGGRKDLATLSRIPLGECFVC